MEDWRTRRERLASEHTKQEKQRELKEQRQALERMQEAKRRRMYLRRLGSGRGGRGWIASLWRAGLAGRVAVNGDCVAAQQESSAEMFLGQFTQCFEVELARAEDGDLLHFQKTIGAGEPKVW